MVQYPGGRQEGASEAARLSPARTFALEGVNVVSLGEKEVAQASRPLERSPCRIGSERVRSGR